MNTTTLEALKSLQIAVGKLDAAMAPSDLEAQVSEIAAVATACKRELRLTQALLNSASFNPAGFSMLVPNLWCGSFGCQVLDRRNPDGTRDYLLATDLGTGTPLPIAKFEHAPETTDISAALEKAGMLDAPLGIGYEYAFNLDGHNDTSNFSSSVLRDCAVDEAILALLKNGSEDLADHQIITFEIHADGAQCEEAFPDIDEWIAERNIPTPMRDAAAGEHVRQRS